MLFPIFVVKTGDEQCRFKAQKVVFLPPKHVVGETELTREALHDGEWWHQPPTSSRLASVRGIIPGLLAQLTTQMCEQRINQQVLVLFVWVLLSRTHQSTVDSLLE